MTEKVVQIRTRLTDAPPVEVRRKGWQDCGHKHVEVDETLRTIACRDCGEERLDPVEVVLMFGRTWNLWQWQLDELRKAKGDADRRALDSWQGQVDRHMGAHPDHREDFDPHRTGWVGEGRCRICRRLEVRAPRRLLAPTPGRPA